MKLRLGLIGCGVVGRRHAGQLRDDSRVELVVCCDPVIETARALRDEFAPQAAVETDAPRAMADYRLQGVIIGSPTQLHYEHCCRAFELGLPVLCEKPMAARREEIVDLIERSRQGHFLMLGYQRRYRAPYATARRELTERADWYGPLKQVHLYVCERWQQTIHGTWRDDPLVGAGYFGDAGSHQIDVVNFISGQRPVRVFAHSEKRGSQVEITTEAIAQLSGGAGLFAHFVGDANHWREDIYFHCRDGDLLLRSEKLLRAKANQVEDVPNLLPENTPALAFVDALLEGKPTVSPPELALPMYDWTAAVLESCSQGSWVELADVVPA